MFLFCVGTFRYRWHGFYFCERRPYDRHPIQGVVGRGKTGGDRPLLKTRWAGSVDAAGGPILAATLKSTAPYGVVVCCGNAASPDLPINVYPFILRGVRLIGIDSQNCPMPARRKAWEMLGGPWKVERLDALTIEISLDALDAHKEKMRSGQRRGRIVVRLKD